MPKSLVEATLEILKGNVGTEIEEKTPTVNETYLGLAEEYAGQLDELSKKTLKSYVKKARDSAIIAGQERGREDEFAHQASRLHLNKDNPIRGEFDSASSGEKRRKISDHIRKRRKGIDTALDKLTREDVEILESLTYEEFEQLDELSKKTLGSYIKKASGTFDHERKTLGKVSASAEDARRYVNDPKNDPYYGSNGNHTVYNKLSKKLTNRRDGIKKAINRLTKEEFEQLDELSKKTLKSYIKRASGADQDPTKHIFDKPSTTLRNTTKYLNDPENKIFGKNYNTSTRNKTKKTDDNRRKGINTALDKLTREEVEELDENWSKGASSSNITDSLKASKYKTKAEFYDKAAASTANKESPHYHNYKMQAHSAWAKHVKHAYHADKYGVMSDAKKDYKLHMQSYKDHKAARNKLMEDFDLVEHEFDLDFSQDELDYIDSIINGEDD